MINQFLINGKNSPGLNPFDRGLAFGDGVFRTIKIENGIPKFWKYHYEILKYDAKSIFIDIPSSRTLLADIKKLFDNNGDFVAKIIITRGVSERGYQYKKNIKCTRILLKNKFNPISKKIRNEGVNLQICKFKLSENTRLHRIKHLNRLENVIAKSELKSGYFDGILLDKNNHINECISSTIIMRKGDKLFVPKQINAGIQGVTKKIICEKYSALGLSIKIKEISVDELFACNEVVIVNSILGAIPVRKVNQNKFKIYDLADGINKIFNALN